MMSLGGSQHRPSIKVASLSLPSWWLHTPLCLAWGWRDRRWAPEPWAFRALPDTMVVEGAVRNLWLLPERVRESSCHRYRAPSHWATSQSCCHQGWGQVTWVFWTHMAIPQSQRVKRGRVFIPFLCSCDAELRMWSQARLYCLFAVQLQASHLTSLSLRLHSCKHGDDTFRNTYRWNKAIHKGK